MILFLGLVLCYTANAQLVINTPTTFTSIDNSGDDSDPAVGIFEYNGNLTIANGGSITNNDVDLPATVRVI
jgi:hypothetical protein